MRKFSSTPLFAQVKDKELMKGWLTKVMVHLRFLLGWDRGLGKIQFLNFNQSINQSIILFKNAVKIFSKYNSLENSPKVLIG